MPDTKEDIAQVHHHAKQPSGLLPKHIQAWVECGVAVVIIVILLVVPSSPPAKKAAAPRPVGATGDLGPQVRALQESIRREQQRIEEEKAAIEKRRQTPELVIDGRNSADYRHAQLASSAGGETESLNEQLKRLDRKRDYDSRLSISSSISNARDKDHARLSKFWSSRGTTQRPTATRSIRYTQPHTPGTKGALMPTRRAAEAEEIAVRYIEANFDKADRLAVVVINRRIGAVLQRLAKAEAIAAPDFQAWLRFKNAHGCDIYSSMNTVRPDARTREKGDIGEVRHVYLDVDNDGAAVAKAMLTRADLPRPNHIVHSSPDKRQIIWRVERFEKEQAEELQRTMVREFGADPAATDCSRVLRLPGFVNQKYATPEERIRVTPNGSDNRIPAITKRSSLEELPLNVHIQSYRNSFLT